MILCFWVLSFQTTGLLHQFLPLSLKESKQGLITQVTEGAVNCQRPGNLGG